MSDIFGLSPFNFPPRGFGTLSFGGDRAARTCPCCGQVFLASPGMSLADLSRNYLSQMPRRDPGVYWTRTGGKTWRVEVVR